MFPPFFFVDFTNRGNKGGRSNKKMFTETKETSSSFIKIHDLKSLSQFIDKVRLTDSLQVLTKE